MDLSVKTKQMNSALFFAEEMNKDQITADSYTYSIILNGLKLNNSSEKLVRSILSKIIQVLNVG